jgi:hypothetical protein
MPSVRLISNSLGNSVNLKRRSTDPPTADAWFHGGRTSRPVERTRDRRLGKHCREHCHPVAATLGASPRSPSAVPGAIVRWKARGDFQDVRIQRLCGSADSLSGRERTFVRDLPSAKTVDVAPTARTLQGLYSRPAGDTRTKEVLIEAGARG